MISLLLLITLQSDNVRCSVSQNILKNSKARPIIRSERERAVQQITVDVISSLSKRCTLKIAFYAKDDETYA